MVLADDDEHCSDDGDTSDDEPHMTEPFWFVCTIKIGHVLAKLCGDMEYECVKFIWANWFDLESPGGWSHKCPPVFSLSDANEHSLAFGFVHLLAIIRAVHMIPVFMGASSAAPCGTTQPML